MTPPTFAELHGRVPELRPNDVCADSDGRLGFRFHGAVHYASGPNYESVDHPIADSLCCMAAIEWLAKQGYQVGVQFSDGAWRVLYSQAHWSITKWQTAPTLSEAVRMAVDAVSKEGK